jgi:protein ImuA
MKRAVDKEIIKTLQGQILKLQGNKAQPNEQTRLGLGVIEDVFPEGVFPKGVVHEMISFDPPAASSTSGFLSVILGKLMQKEGRCIWVSSKRKIFPPALKIFGVDPERILFVDAWRAKDALWTIEEALKCNSLSAVVGEIGELNFNDSRRLQLVVEKSNVTGFIHRYQPKALNAVACATRWKITPVASHLPDEMPGVGFPRWDVELLKVKNGKPHKWIVQWGSQEMEYLSEDILVPQTYRRKTA